MKNLPEIDPNVKSWICRRIDSLVLGGMPKDQSVDCALQEMSGRSIFYFSKDGKLVKARRFPGGFKRVAESEFSME